MILTIAAAIAVSFAAASFTSEASSEVTFHETKEEAAAELREGMKDRKETVTVGLLGSTDKEGLKATIGDLMDIALEHTGDPREGDYLKFQYSSYKGVGRTTYDGFSPAMEIQYTLEYYDNAEQEAEVDKKVEEIIESLDLEGMTDYDKIVAIHDYICINTDYEDAEKDIDIKRTAYGALVKGEAVCQGYSLAFYRLLLEAGIDNRILFGTGIEDDGIEGPHTWNAVELGGEYYYTDVTWDDNTISRDYLMKPAGSGFEKKHILDEEYEEKRFEEQDSMATDEYEDAGSDAKEMAMLPVKFFKGFINSVKLFAAWVKEA